MPRVGNTFANEHRSRSIRSRPCDLGGKVHSQKAADDRQIADAVNRETHALTKVCHDRTGQSRADDARAVDQSRIEGNSAGEIILPDDLLQEGLPRRHLESLQRAGHEGQSKDLPDIDPATDSQHTQGQGLAHEQYLRRETYAVAIETVGNDASE